MAASQAYETSHSIPSDPAVLSENITNNSHKYIITDS